ncbi:hypothetical protein SADUNF_Sadunf05G0171200 [Salix dunnii]|uniref:Uncharacterized protein n=1 Tax=Salix dunnii TaxID=1413687 RepID=A0A835MZR4_9ROSI|nr:hypothetical protein SADUNF_Sadunf05G0171200 [Salix dunnii]
MERKAIMKGEVGPKVAGRGRGMNMTLSVVLYRERAHNLIAIPSQSFSTLWLHHKQPSCLLLDTRKILESSKI